jgi:CspA family cold shock protein
MIGDLITLLENTIQPDLQKGRYPDRKVARRVSDVVKAVARELDA